MDRIALRPPAQPPALDIDNAFQGSRNHKVVFKHPAYPEEFGQNHLLTLFAWDSPRGGLHAGTALIVCALLACNSFDGYLTIDRSGEKLNLRDDDILPLGEYYFHVCHPSAGLASAEGLHEPYKYPIYPSFDHWAFPHNKIPAQWLGSSSSDAAIATELDEEPATTPSVSALSAAVLARDKACAISKHRDYLERAHLCPRSETDWFQKNGMRQYNDRLDLPGDCVTDDMANAIAMRADIHRAFDECRFVLVRKNELWVAHFLELTYELGRMHHNRRLEFKPGISAMFLLVRLAWAIFPHARAFLEAGGPKLVRVRERTSDGIREVDKIVHPAEVSRIVGANRGRSASPKKRKAAESSSNLPDAVEANCRHSEGEPPLNFSPQSQDSSGSCAISCLDRARDKVPSLFSDCSTPDYLKGHNEYIIARELDISSVDPEDFRIAALKKKELKKQRPRDPALICCDYRVAENANELGIEGKSEYGGGHLCMECLGLEILQDDSPD